MKKTICRALAPALFALITLWSTGHVATAGTTGAISGSLVDSASGAPIVNPNISAGSPSQSGGTHTDGVGRFGFLSLIPDTYTLTASRDGYQTTTQSGVTVFADQSQNIVMRAQKSAKTLGTITTISSALSPVRAGTTTDVYSVNPALTKAAST